MWAWFSRARGSCSSDLSWISFPRQIATSTKIECVYFALLLVQYGALLAFDVVPGARVVGCEAVSALALFARLVALSCRFRGTMDRLNQYMEAYRTPQDVRERLRAYVIYCR